MSGPGAFSGEMPGFPFPGRPGRELDESLLDMILNGQSLPPDAPEEMHALAEMLADLVGPAEPGELAGEAAARFAFARGASPAGVSPAARRRLSWLSSLSTRLAAVLVAGAVGLGSVAAAAYAGMLPGPMQDLAYRAIGAPPARHAPGARQATNRLCDAYQHARIYGPARAEALAYQKLEKAAGGAGKVDTYCPIAEWAGVAPPGPAAPPAQPKAPRPAKPPAKPTPTTPTTLPMPMPMPAPSPAPTLAPSPAPAPSPASAPSLGPAPTPTATPAPAPTSTPDAHQARRH
jgi:hypothetical protein